jgi:hypothetical protein
MVGRWAMTLAATDADLDEWWRVNLTWIRSVQAAHPDAYASLVAAGRHQRTTIASRKATGPSTPGGPQRVTRTVLVR